MTKEIDQKWQSQWKDAALFDVDPAKSKKKKFITAAFPYPNSPQHIGHGRTYTTADIYTRYLRMHGYHVLFPMAFHVTGTPIVAMAKRIADKDEEVLRVFEEIYGISRKKTASLTKPEDLVMYFSKEIELGMKEMGYSIDWRRKFYSFDKKFNKFIEWQFRKLKEMDYLVQGNYPVAWCPSDNMAVSDHSRSEGEGETVKDFIWVKFHLKDSDLILMTGTTRPDALLGQANLWVDPKATYQIVKVGKEKWVVGKKAIRKIEEQFDKVEVVGEIKSSELMGKWCKGPLVDYELYVLPAWFIDSSLGSGIVYSALEDPVDLYELWKIQNSLEMIEKYKLDKDVVAKLKPIPIIDVPGMGKNLGADIGKEFHITSAEQTDKLDEAKDELNKRVFRKGVMNKDCGKYSGMSVPKCQEILKKELYANNEGVMFYELSGKVVCRCLTECIVKVVDNQWFIDYGKEKWKKLAKECLEKMGIIPEKTRNEYLYAINWFKQKPCARTKGLGTPLPFDKNLMVDALSDSTIYTAFYTFVHLLENIPEKEMDEAFFDYVLLGKGKGKPKWKQLRESFSYWYPCDSRHSAGDLIRNHLPFYIFNHVAIFAKKEWPKQIVTNGFVLMDEKKMSKSMGNILPLRKAIQEYGADVVRFSIVSGAELSQDADFSRTVAEGTKTRLQFIFDLVKKAAKEKTAKTSRIEAWLLSSLHQRLKKTPQMYERLALRELALEFFYETYSDLRWALKREPSVSLSSFFKTWTPVIAPFIPHHAEEFWSLLGNKPFVSTAQFPKANSKHIDESAELGEQLIKTVFHDIEKIAELVGKKPSNVYIYAASPWKFSLYKLTQMEKDMQNILKKAAKHPILRHYMKDATRIVKAWSKKMHTLPPILTEQQEFETLQHAQSFFSEQLNCKVHILREKGAKHDKAKNSLPGKPAIVLE